MTTLGLTGMIALRMVISIGKAFGHVEQGFLIWQAGLMVAFLETENLSLGTTQELPVIYANVVVSLIHWHRDVLAHAN